MHPNHELFPVGTKVTTDRIRERGTVTRHTPTRIYTAFTEPGEALRERVFEVETLTERGGGRRSWEESAVLKLETEAVVAQRAMSDASGAVYESRQRLEGLLAGLHSAVRVGSPERIAEELERVAAGLRGEVGAELVAAARVERDAARAYGAAVDAERAVSAA